MEQGPLSDNSSDKVRVFISIFKKYSRTNFGIRIHWFGEIIFAAGWFGNQKVNAQMIALDCALSAIELADASVRVEAIFRTEYIRQRLDMARSRRLAQQAGIPKKPMQEDEARWQSVAFRVVEADVGIRMALNEEEKQELSLIDRKLDDLLFDDRAFRFSTTPIEPTIVLPELDSPHGI